MTSDYDGRTKRRKICNHYGWSYSDYTHHITSWYEEGMSSHEIAEKIYIDSKIRINPRSIMRVVPCRSVKEAYQNAIERGRVVWGKGEKTEGQFRVSVARRMLVLQRDNFKCQACGDSPAINKDTVLEIDHKTSRANGGSNEIENLQTLCRRCNKGKGALNM